MADEVELKLAVPADAQRALLRHPLLRGSLERKRETLDNIYFDTPELALQRRGIALRLRRQGRLWLQTVKCAGISAGGLSARPEWETPYTGRFNFAGIDDDEVRKWLRRPKVAEQLLPTFETRFSRITWRIATNDSENGGSVLVTLDRGWIIAGGRREIISELEIELVVGKPASLLAVASKLALRLPLMPAVRSKAERGYCLHAGMPLAPSKAISIAINAEMHPAVAFRAIVNGCLEHLQLNLVGAVESEDPEFIHQMRVACRRLRAALRLFAPVIPESFDERWLPGLRALMSRLGRLRDLDVLETDILAPVQRALAEEPRLAALTGRVAEQRMAARCDVLDALHGAEYRQLLLTLMGALQEEPFIGTERSTANGSEPAERGGAGDLLTVGRFATKRLYRLHAKVIVLARLAQNDDPASLHRLRIAIKRLRYGLEFFTPLMAERPLRHLLHSLIGLQDKLGQLNDLSSAGVLLMRSAGEVQALREAVALVGGWHGLRHSELLKSVARLVARISQTKLPRDRSVHG